ncbi:MAG: hypothetical protein V4581_03595 [Bacteroidota bacterium]
MGFTTLSVMVQSCIGGLTAMTILMNGTSPAQMVQLFFTVILCSGFNGAVLAQQSPKLVFNLLIVSVVVNILLMIVNVM